MLVIFLFQLVDFAVRALVLLVIVQVVLSYVMSPLHPVRQAIDRLVEPMLMPIRRFVPPVGGLDFSPLVLVLLIEVVGMVLKSLLVAL